MTAAEKSKTTNPVKIKPDQITEDPFRFNGVVLTEGSRGSGFSAWNNRAFFSAAHVVYNASWGAPPLWVPAANSKDLDPADAVRTRGYFRFSQYADLVAENDPAHFSRDVILGYSFRKLIDGKPAALNLRGNDDLRTSARSMITGYPAKNAYFDEGISGYFLHKTGPAVTPYQKDAGAALRTTLLTTGPGNSGGPVWTKHGKAGWKAAGVLVGGLPSETVVYAFSDDANALIQAAGPVLKRKMGAPVIRGGVTGTSLFFPYNHKQTIPDGVQRWTSLRIGVDKFPDESLISDVKLSLDIRTKHRGDLQIILEGPGGYQALVHNEEGAGKNNLVFKGKDFTSAFTGIDPNGYWYLRIQDRLKGDVSTFKSARLEISVDGGTEVPVP